MSMTPEQILNKLKEISKSRKLNIIEEGLLTRLQKMEQENA